MHSKTSVCFLLQLTLIADVSEDHTYKCETIYATNINYLLFLTRHKMFLVFYVFVKSFKK